MAEGRAEVGVVRAFSDGARAVKHAFWQKFVTRSRRHHEGFQCFSRYEEMQELGS